MCGGKRRTQDIMSQHAKESEGPTHPTYNNMISEAISKKRNSKGLASLQSIKAYVGDTWTLPDGWEKRVSHYVKSMADAELVSRDKGAYRLTDSGKKLLKGTDHAPARRKREKKDKEEGDEPKPKKARAKATTTKTKAKTTTKTSRTKKTPAAGTAGTTKPKKARAPASKKGTAAAPARKKAAAPKATGGVKKKTAAAAGPKKRASGNKAKAGGKGGSPKAK